jgi:hypothetical protein
MRANRVFDLTVRRSGAAPAWLADPARTDHVELVDIASGEVVLFWDCTPTEASRLGRELRESMAELESEDFMAYWRDRSR